MDDPSKPATPWTASRSAKEKNAVQRAVTALLDELAPERVLKRVEQLRNSGGVEQHRTPSGCVLQAAKAAVTVSWFADPGDDSPLGELHVVVWKGVVSRRGTRPRPEGATAVKELVLRPIENPTNETVWRAKNGAEYDSVSLAAHSLALLEEQVVSTD